MRQCGTWHPCYYLAMLERVAIGEDEPELVPNRDEDQVNLEHILPKNPSDSDWPQFTPEDQRLFVHRIGNLTLLKKGANGRIGNKPWSVKQPILASSELVLTKKAADETDWTKEVIDARQLEMAGLAVQAWPHGFYKGARHLGIDVSAHIQKGARYRCRVRRFRRSL